MDRRIRIIDRQICFHGFLKLACYRLRHTRFNGDWGPLVVRERIEGLRAAAVLLYDAIRDEVVLVEQFRVGALEEGCGAWVLEPVGGVMAKGADPGEVVRREAKEEAGCDILALETIGTYYVSPGLSDERVWLFCGRVDAESAHGIHGLLEEGEETRVVVIDAEQAFSELFCGRINSSTAIISTQWLAVNRARLRSHWGAG